MNKLRWGVLSTARIAVEKVIPAMQRGRFSAVVAIASRDLAKAREAASRLGVPKAYGSYEELLADSEIDAVYNPLPNHLHVPLSIRALAAGKHVLCEKPIALTSSEGQELVAAAEAQPRLKVMEAFMYRHHPQWQQARRLVLEGRIGELRTIDTFFSYYNVDPHNIRNIPELGGGALMDIGCYPISLARFVFGAEPRRAIGSIEYDPRFAVDRLVSAVLEFESGTATFTCATQVAPRQRVNIHGSGGRIEIEIPFNAPNDRPCKMWLQHGRDLEEILLETCDQYTLQGDVFSRCVLDDTPVPTPISDAVANMQVIEAIVESYRRGIWIRCGG